jgi:hypothetical protein
VVSLEYRIGDVFDRMAEIPDGSIDLIVTSPPFLALRSYLPADHPDKAKEIGSEATPADFLDTLLALSAEWGRVLAPHGSLCVELGDTYAGTHPKAALTAVDWNGDGGSASTYGGRGNKKTGGGGWPLDKSLTGIPTLYPWSLAYGRNLLTGQPSPAGQWRIRNVIVWARPNPPVGALGDKFRPATSYITVACRGAKRYFDLDAVRTTPTQDPATYTGNGYTKGAPAGIAGNEAMPGNPAGAPPLDWHTDHHPEDGDWLWNAAVPATEKPRHDPARGKPDPHLPDRLAAGGHMGTHPNGAPPLDFQDDLPGIEDGDWLWKMSTQGYAGSHYATFPMALPKRLIEAMCPLRVCTVCGRPSERIVDHVRTVNGAATPHGKSAGALHSGGPMTTDFMVLRSTLGWTDCGCSQIFEATDTWRTGVVLDPFAGSGTTLEAAQAVGRHAIGIDLDHRNADLAQSRCGMFLTVEGAA